MYSVVTVGDKIELYVGKLLREQILKFLSHTQKRKEELAVSNVVHFTQYDH